MPDWAMILIKCVLWVVVVQRTFIVLGCTYRGCTIKGWRIAIPVVAAVILAALEGWITP